jgi:hypothetical protein
MALSDLTQRLTEQFERLNPRERVVVSVGGTVALVIIMLMAWMVLSGLVENRQLRVTVKKGQLEQLIKLQATYAKRAEQSRRLEANLKGSKIRLVSMVEENARAIQIEVGDMTPHETEPDADGIKESSVDIKLQKLSIDRLQDFLKRLETTPGGLVRVKRLRMHKRFDDQTLLDVEMTVATYQMG